MPDPRIYANQEAFRQALGERLKQRSQENGIDLNRLYKQVAFERLLARFFNEDLPRWLLKGGYAIELWLGGRARATKDIDLTIPHLTFISKKDVDNLVVIRELLQEKAAQDMGDYFQFFIGEKILELHDAPAGGARFPVEARLAGRTFTKFHLDIGIGDEVIGKIKWRTGHELLSFAGISPARIALIPVEQQFAEKIHALTKPRGEIPNSRVKDLADLVLLIEYGLPEAGVVVQAIRATFDRRNTHTIPMNLKMPPKEWEPVYKNFVRDFNLPATSINEAFERVTTYWKTLFKD